MAKTTIDAIYTNGNATAVRTIDCGSSTPYLKGVVRLNMFTGLTAFNGGDNDLENIIGFNSLTTLKRFEVLGANTVSFDVNTLPTNLEYFDIRGLNSTFGDLSSLPTTLISYTNTGRNTTIGLLCGLPLNLETYINTGQNITSGPLSGLPRDLTDYQNQGNNTTTGLLCGLPANLLTYINIGSNTTTGDLSGLPRSLETFNCQGNNTTTGNLSGLPRGLILFDNRGNNTTTGNLSGLPSNLILFNNRGNNTTTGNLSALNSNLTYYDNRGDNTVYDYYDGTILGFAQKNWANGQKNWNLQPALSSGVPGMSPYHLATLVVDLSGVTWEPPRDFTANGNNNPWLNLLDCDYGEKLEAAINALSGQGVTVSLNLTALLDPDALNYFNRVEGITEQNKQTINKFITKLKCNNLWDNLVEGWLLSKDYNIGSGITVMALKNGTNQGTLFGQATAFPTWENTGIKFYEGFQKPNFNQSRLEIQNWTASPLTAPMSIACVYTPFSSLKPSSQAVLGPGACLFGQTSIGGGPGQHFGINYGFTLSAVDFYYGSNSIEGGTFFNNITGGPAGPYYMSSLVAAPDGDAYAYTNTRSFLLTSDYSSNATLTAVAFSYSLNGGFQNHEFDGIISAGFVFSSAIDYSTFYNIYKNTLGAGLNLP